MKYYVHRLWQFCCGKTTKTRVTYRTWSVCLLFQILIYAQLILPLPVVILVSKVPHILSYENYLGQFWKNGLEKRIFTYSCLKGLIKTVKKGIFWKTVIFYKFLDVTLISRVFIRQSWNYYILRDQAPIQTSSSWNNIRKGLDKISFLSWSWHWKKNEFVKRWSFSVLHKSLKLGKYKYSFIKALFQKMPQVGLMTKSILKFDTNITHGSAKMRGA